MCRLASLLQEFDVMMDIKGTGPITGSHIMAEIGDVRRLTHEDTLVAFAGFDSPPRFSEVHSTRRTGMSKSADCYACVLFCSESAPLYYSAKTRATPCMYSWAGSALRENTFLFTGLPGLQSSCASTTPL